MGPLDANLEIAARSIVEAFSRVIAGIHTSDEWVSQYASPLGKRAHLAACRAGLVPSRKVGKRVLVKSSDLNAFIERHPTAAKPVTISTPSEMDALVARALDGYGVATPARVWRGRRDRKAA